MSIGTLLVDQVLLKLDGNDFSDAQYDSLKRVQVSRSLGTISHAELLLDDEDLEFVDTIEPGQALEVLGTKGNDPTSDVSLFKGTITSVGLKVSYGLRNGLKIEALDDARKLGNQVDFASGLNLTVSDILTQIAGTAGLSTEITTTSTTFDHWYRTGTPIQFLDMLALRYGYCWSIDDDTLVVAPVQSASSVATLTHGEDLMWLDARMTTQGLPKAVKVRGWDPSRKESIVGQAAQPGAHTFPSNGFAPSSLLGQLSDDGELVVHRPDVPSQAEADSVAQGIADRIGSMAVSARGETPFNPAIAPGVRIALAGVGTKWSGDYTVSEVEHVWGADQALTTRFAVGSFDRNGLTDLLGGSPATVTGAELGTGISVGVVTNIEDPDGLGRVKVKLPAVADDLETAWARVVCLGAGAERGLLVMPEVDDEVAVVFENGDLQRPFVIGGLWNGVDAQPSHHATVTNGAVTARSLTSTEGTYVALVESAGEYGEPAVHIETANGKLVLHLGEDLVEMRTDNLDVTFENSKSKLEMLTGGAVSIINQSGDISISAGAGNVTIEGNNIELKANAGIKTNATGNTEIKGTGPVKVESSAITEIKGSMVKLN